MILKFTRIDPELMGPRHPYRKDIKPYLSDVLISNVHPNEVINMGRLNFWNKSSDQINVQHINRSWIQLKTTGYSRFLSRLHIKRKPKSLCCLVVSGNLHTPVSSDRWLELALPCQLWIPTHPSVQNAGSSIKACSHPETRYVKYSIELISKTAYKLIPDTTRLNNSNVASISPTVHNTKPPKKNPRSRAARLSQEEQLKMYTKQGGRCALCGDKLLRKKGGRGASLWNAEADHSVPHSLRAGNEKPNQWLCPTCHALKSAIEWHKSRKSGDSLSRAKLSFKEFKNHLHEAYNVSEFLNNENQLVALHSLIRRGNWRPDKNVSHKKLADIVGKLFNRGYHPVHNPQRLPVLRQYEIFPQNSVPLKLYEDIHIKRLVPHFGTEPGTRFYAHDNRFWFSKDGKTVTMSANGIGDVASLVFDGRRGEINRIEWTGGRKVNVYVKSTKSTK